MSDEQNQIVEAQAIDTKDFQATGLTVIRKRFPQCQVALTVSCDADHCEGSYKEAVKLINKEVSLPGFRKGKAPQKLVEEHFGKHIEREWKEQALRSAFTSAMKIVDSFPMSEKSIRSSRIESIERRQGGRFVFEYESEPVVPELSLDEFAFELSSFTPPTEEEIDAEVLSLRNSRATWQPHDRPAQVGDFVTVTMDSIEAPAHNVCTNRRVEVSEKTLDAWLLASIVGMKAGESKDIESAAPDGASEEEKAQFEAEKFRISASEVSERVPAAIDARFLKWAGAETFEELRENTRVSLSHVKENEVRQKDYQKLEELLMQKIAFDVPKSMLEAEKATRLRQEIARLRNEGLSKDEIAQKETEVKQKAHEVSEKNTRHFFLVRQLAARLGVEVDEVDVQTRVWREQFLRSIQSGQGADKWTPSEKERQEMRFEAEFELMQIGLYRKILKLDPINSSSV